VIDPTIQERLRALPAVDQLAAELLSAEAVSATAAEANAAARAVLDARRRELLDGDDDAADLAERAQRHLAHGPRRVLNATGVIIHTNLGRAPLASPAAAAVAAAASGYLDLEFELQSGRRGARDAHVSALLCELTGAQDAIVVNNGAAAVLLAAAALAGPGKSIVVSRGQLVEIGGGFRVPDVVAQAGAELIEVGTTNRTKLDDYKQALAGGGDVILRVHPSNFRTLGFVEEVGVGALCALGAPVIDDLGSGVLAGDLDGLVADEPPVRDSITAGAAIVCFSGDKLLGGPQAGILVGQGEAIARCRRHPLARALRLGRLPLAGLVATLKLYRDPQRAVNEIPVLAMLSADAATLTRRAQWLAEQTGGELINSVGRAGGGSLPLLELHGPAVALTAAGGADALAARLRDGTPPLIARIVDGRVVVDPRTLLDDHELEQAAAVIIAALG
jgi:L-seryl-tRNA(Ser) seleniumtransferase